MLRINYYISGHGYGHATRSAQLVSALLSASPTTLVTIITTAPSHLFPSSPRVSFIAQEVDSAIIQPQPYTIDAPASFAKLKTFLASTETPEWRAKTADILDQTQCNLVLADAPYPVAWTSAREKGIKSVLVSNFSFDSIFEQLLTYLPAESRGAETEMVQKIEKLYATYDYIVRLPGYIPFPFADKYWTVEERARRLIDAPLVFRPPRTSRSNVLKLLGIPEEFHEHRVLLVQFGGQIVDATGESTVPQLPDGWICLSSTPVEDPRFFTFPKDVYSPDLVAASNVVLGKIGYGTVSECVGMNKALIYVIRPMFAEEPGLLRYMEENGVCGEISVADYESGNWAGSIEKASKAHGQKEHVDVAEESPRVAQMIGALVALLVLMKDSQDFVVTLESDQQPLVA
ncbi:uncharacterized protein L3040_002608 [Drepanopeziza brunnea f. sp. 'multigermtubi']|uniref:uncharacterized protein n=1 Tax=Drepanopeziza brunnea f. sp. 'multigermtubi' TaxID=698441 RepID=UPI0023A73B0C|nr:hypothetical protein L3040_002608 [Drepanopeziza brunnea f. sp. 'multigermtubi']